MLPFSSATPSSPPISSSPSSSSSAAAAAAASSTASAAPAASSAAEMPPRTVHDIFIDYGHRSVGLISALTWDFRKFHASCDPAKGELSLYGEPNSSWEVRAPSGDLTFPEPMRGIVSMRDKLGTEEWVAALAIASDVWLIAVAFFLGKHLNAAQRLRLYIKINFLPTVFERVSDDRKKIWRSRLDSASGSTQSTERLSTGEPMNNVEIENFNWYSDDDDGGEESHKKKKDDRGEGENEEYDENICGICGGYFNKRQFWIQCGVCKRWFHGKCVKITIAQADVVQYKCRRCSDTRASH